MFKSKTIPAFAVAALMVSACSNDAEPQPAAPPTDEAEANMEEPTVAQPDEPAPVGDEQDEDQPATFSVGDPITLIDDAGGNLQVTLDAVEYLPDHLDDGTVALMSFTVDNTEGDQPVSLYAPIDGGGWHHVTDDGTMQSFYENNQGYSTTIHGNGTTPLHSGPYSPGAQETPLVDYLVLDEPGGTIAYVQPDGLVQNEIDLPTESVNTDNPGLVTAHGISERFEGRIIDAW